MSPEAQLGDSRGSARSLWDGGGVLFVYDSGYVKSVSSVFSKIEIAMIV